MTLTIDPMTDETIPTRTTLPVSRVPSPSVTPTNGIIPPSPAAFSGGNASGAVAGPPQAWTPAALAQIAVPQRQATAAAIAHIQAQPDFPTRQAAFEAHY